MNLNLILLIEVMSWSMKSWNHSVMLDDHSYVRIISMRDRSKSEVTVMS